MPNPDTTDLQRAAAIILKNDSLDKLYDAQQQVFSDYMRLFVRIALFVLIYWPLRPLFYYGGLKHWAEGKKRALWNFAGKVDERNVRTRQACLDAGVPDGVIPIRWFR